MQIGIEGTGMTIVLNPTAIDGKTGDRTTHQGPGMNMTVVGTEIETVILIGGDHAGGNMMTEIDDNVVLHLVVLVSSLLNALRYRTYQSIYLIGSSDYGRHRSPTSSRYRPPTTRSRGDSPSISLVPSPSSNVKLGSHPLTSPTSSRRLPMTPRRRSHSRSRSRSLTPPPRRQSYSRSPRRRLSPISKTERYPSPGIPITSPSRSRKTSRHQTPKRNTSRSRSPEPPSPVKHEVAEDVIVLSGDRSTVARSRIRDDHSLPPPLAAASEADPDVKTTNPIQNIPTGPRNAGCLPREPPRGPRGYAPQPHSPTGPASRPPPTQSRNIVAPSVASGSTPARTEVAASPKVESETILPVIPPYTIKTTLKPEIESEVRPPPFLNVLVLIAPQITRLRAQRTNLISEYANISKATRRALHELEMASFDLRTAENRRKLADMHLEKARMGVLGIDYVPDGT